MNDNAERKQGLYLKIGLGIVMAVIVLILGSFWLVLGQGAQMQQLMPLLPSPTPPTSIPQQEPESVTFSELNEDPSAYINRSILVTGDYLPADKSACLIMVGPDIRWSLTADNLQLDVLGFERIVPLLSPGTTVTIQGIWRRYEGPIGCGKGPARGSLWYLDAKKIIQPNPLVNAGGQVIPVEIINDTLELPPFIATTVTTVEAPTATMLAVTLTVEGTIQASPTNLGQPVPTQTPILPPEITPSATRTQPPNIIVPTNTPDQNPNVPTATGSITAVPTQDSGNSTPTLTPEPPPLPPTATKTDGYPGPGTFTPVPTDTPDPYP